MIRKIKIFFVICASIYFLYYISTYTQWHFIDYVNLIFHEAGHTMFFFLGDFFRILAGSLFQVLLPLSISIYFLFTQQLVSGSISLMWVGQNIINVSIYVRDSIAMSLPLLGGDSVIHDWNYLLSSLGMLQHTNTIASVFYYLGVVTILAGILFAVIYSTNIDSNKSSVQTDL